MDILLAITGAFGAGGGIAKFNRDLCRALSAKPLAAKVAALPRVPHGEPVDSVPSRVDYRSDVAGSKLKYAVGVVRTALEGPRSTEGTVICGHLNLLPVAAVSSWVRGDPLLLVLHGIEAWQPHKSWIVRQLLPNVNRFVAVSEYTKTRFLDWAPLREEQGHVIPNCIDVSNFGPGPKREDLLTRYGLHDRTTLLTLGRLSSEEQYKGHDEILEVLPDLADDIPDVAYLVCGNGDDRPRLERKAERLGVSDRVVFAGYVPEEEKKDHYRLADAFVMPGHGEGFGIVYLEAMACGIPVVASNADASQEAVREGALGVVVDPNDLEDVRRGILKAVRQNLGAVPDGLDYFSEEAFRNRWHAVLQRNVATSSKTTS